MLHLLFSRQIASAEPFVERTQVHMGTYVSIALPPSQIKHFAPAFAIIAGLDQKLSHYRQDSEISRLNRLGRLQVSEDTLQVLKLAEKYHRRTEGAFDITVGAITEKGYKLTGTADAPPSEESIREALPRIDGKAIAFEGSLVRLKKKGVSIDLGGIGKGFAVDQVSDYLKKNRIDKAKVSASGDIRCFHKCDFFIDSPFEKEKNSDLSKAASRILPSALAVTIGTSSARQRTII